MVYPLTTKIFATLGNNSSLIPLGIKDLGTITGMTAGSYITGEATEAKDRLMDEGGTSLIWLGGIPFFKWIIDKTIYKIAKLNPKIDVRILNDPKIFQKAKEYALPGLKEGFERVEKNQKLFKGLAVAKFIASTALTLASYWGLTVFRHKYTEKAIIKELKKEEDLKKLNNSSTKKETLNNKQQKNPSFGMSASVLNQFIFDPVKNTMVIDAGITTERLTKSVNPQDFGIYGLREGGFLFAIYVVSEKIQQYIEKKAAESHRPIDLDIRILQDENFKKAFADGSIKKHLTKFSINGTDAEIYESLFKKGDNLVVQMAKKANIIKTVKNSDKIDSQYFIDIEKIKGIKNKPRKKDKFGLKDNIENLYTEFKKSGKNVNEFFSEVIKLKKSSIIKGIGTSIGLLGIVIPGIILISRLSKEDNKEFRVKRELREKMQKEKAAA